MKLVLLHAFPLDERMWEPLLPGLDGYDVIAPNLYRMGDSIDSWAEDVLGRVEGSFAACGSSMGGYCALAIARRAPERLSALLLAGARVGADSPERRAARAGTIDLVRSGGAQALWDDMRPKLFPAAAPEAAVRLAREITLEQDSDRLVAAVGAIRDRPDSTEAVASLSAPVRFVVGEHDPFLSVEEARSAAASARAGRLHVIEGAGHLPSMERPEEFNGVLLGVGR